MKKLSGLNASSGSLHGNDTRQRKQKREEIISMKKRNGNENREGNTLKAEILNEVIRSFYISRLENTVLFKYTEARETSSSLYVYM